MVITSVVVSIYSPTAGLLATMVMLAALCRPDLIPAVTVGIVACLPMRSIFSARAAELTSTAVMAQNIESGDVIRQGSILLLFGIGIVLLVRSYPAISSSTALKCFSGYLLLALCSSIWSADSVLTLRRVAVAAASTTFAAGLAAGYYGQRLDGNIRLIRHISIVGTLCCAIVIGVAVVAGNVHPFDLAWRLGSEGRENQISWVAAVPFLAAFVTRGNREYWPSKALLSMIIAVTLTVVLFSKSRTTILATGLGIIVAETVRARNKWKVAAALVITGVLLVGSSALLDQLWNRGATSEQIETVSGRTMLWEVVWRDVLERPLTGHGYGAYWTAARVNSQAVEWAPTSAHNGYLDTVAQLGIVGLLIVIAFIIISARDAWLLSREGSTTRDVGILLLALVTGLVITNSTESYIESLDYFPLFATLTLIFHASLLRRSGSSGFNTSGPLFRMLN